MHSCLFLKKALWLPTGTEMKEAAPLPPPPNTTCFCCHRQIECCQLMDDENLFISMQNAHCFMLQVVNVLRSFEKGGAASAASLVSVDTPAEGAASSDHSFTDSAG